MGLYDSIKKNYNRKTNFKLSESNKGRKGKRSLKESAEGNQDFWSKVDSGEIKKGMSINTNGMYQGEILDFNKGANYVLVKLPNEFVAGWNPEISGNALVWGQGHYFSDEKEAREYFKKKMLGESCRGKRKAIKESIYELGSQYGGRNSYYGKAQVEVNPEGKTLYSYGTPIMTIKDGQVKMLCGEWALTNTTIRHIREFMQQEGLAPVPKAKLVKLIDEQGLDESCKKPVKEAGSKEGAAKRKANRRKKNLEWLKSQVDKKPMADLSDEDKKAITKGIDKSLSTYKESCKGKRRQRKVK